MPDGQNDDSINDSETQTEKAVDIKEKAHKLSKKKDARPPLRFRDTFTFKMAMLIVAVWVSFQVTLMLIYIYVPQYDWFINRFSWTDSQALGLAAAFIAVYGVYKQEQYMWVRFGMKMHSDNMPKNDELEETAIDKLMETIEPIAKVIATIQEEIEKKGITTEDAVKLIHTLTQYEKDIKKWTERMEKLMPIFEGLASSIENVDQKELGKVVGRKIGEYINAEIKKGENGNAEKK